MVKCTSIPPAIVRSFVKVFSQIPQRVIWKWESEEKPENLSSNVLTVEWLPQPDLLGKCLVTNFKGFLYDRSIVTNIWQFLLSATNTFCYFFTYVSHNHLKTKTCLPYSMLTSVILSKYLTLIITILEWRWCQNWTQTIASLELVSAIYGISF